jgi:flagellar basal-body rod protein FlgB
MIQIDMTGAVAARALDGLFARQLAVAHNIANANSPSFAPVRVTFESALQQAAAGATADAAAVRRAPIGVQSMPGESVRMDMEITQSAENVLRYSMLLAMVDRKLQLMSLAINEGRSR